MTRRDLIRSGSVSDPWGWLLVAVLCALAGASQALLVSGCGPSTRYRSSPPRVGDQAPHYETRSPRGVRVLLPVWVRLHPGESAFAVSDDEDEMTYNFQLDDNANVDFLLVERIKTEVL